MEPYIILLGNYMTRKLNCFLIPLHNEETVIEKTLRSFRYAGVSWDDVYLLDDGSTDATLKKIELMKFPLQNVITFKNVGKTKALIAGFIYFNIAQKYEWVGTGDGDTTLAEDYQKQLTLILNDASKSTAAVASRVCSMRDRWNPFPAYRVYEYWLMQNAYKRAQGHMNCITVLPGCGSTFRTEVFDHLRKEIRSDILTEDFLWTIRIHLEGLGKIQYAHALRVFTQDPDRLISYWKQNTRWYKGGWQVYREQKMWKTFANKINAETSFLFIEGLIFSLIFVVAMLAGLSHLWPVFTHSFFFFDISIFIVLTIIGAIFEHDLRLFVFMPLFYFLRIIKCTIFLSSFFNIMVFKSDKKKALSWNKVARY